MVLFIGMLLRMYVGGRLCFSSMPSIHLFQRPAPVADSVHVHVHVHVHVASSSSRVD